MIEKKKKLTGCSSYSAKGLTHTHTHTHKIFAPLIN